MRKRYKKYALVNYLHYTFFSTCIPIFYESNHICVFIYVCIYIHMFVCLQCIFYVHLYKSIDIFSYSIYLSSFPPFPPRVWPGSRAVTFLSPHYRYTWIKSGHLLESSHRYTWFKNGHLLDSSLQVHLVQERSPSWVLFTGKFGSRLRPTSWVLFTGKSGSRLPTFLSPLYR